MRPIRVIAAILCALMLLSTAGAVPFGAGGDCTAQCPDDDDQGHCPPTCVCSCCPHATPCLPDRATPSTFQAPVLVRFLVDQSEPGSAPSRDILHVPKSHLA